MKVVGLDGRAYAWRPRRRPRGKRSSYHLRALAVIRVVHPTDPLLEEVHLPGCPTALYGDFYLPLRRVMVEVQGEQHSNYVAHFHGDRMGYLAALGRDADKRRWCDLNGIRLVELPYDEDDGSWSRRLADAHGGREGGGPPA